jgi:hypothetical protein
VIKRIVAIVLSALLLAPSAAIAQSERAGVVTTLEGNVTARRVAVQDPVALKFRDDVFLQDTVTTGDKSLARMLLGGKAVVTVRERSVLKITEIPGRSVIELETGKFALAVAREKMRPGEEIQIRTPNAIAGVRGTVVITEVNRQTAQLGRAAAGVVTRFWVLRGTVIAQPLDINTRQPLGTPLSLGPMTAYSGAGSAAPRVTPVPPEDVSQITAGLQPTGPKGGTDAGQAQVKAQAVQAAVMLLGALTSSGETQMAAIVGPASATGSFLPTQISETPPIDPLAGVDLGGTQPPAAPVGGSFLGAEAFAAFFFGSPFTGNVTLANLSAVTFDGFFGSASPNPMLAFDHAAIVQTGAGVDLFQVLLAGTVFLQGPLATFHDSSLHTAGSLFDISGGSFTSTTTASLIDLDPTFITTGEAIVAMNGGTLTLAGRLLTDVNGTLTSASQIVRMQGNAGLVSTTTDALIHLTGTTVSTAGALYMANSTMTLNGPLASATGVIGGDGTPAPLFQLEASTLTSTSPDALVQFTSMTVEHEENFLRLGAGSTVTLGGSLLKFTDTNFNAASVDRSFIAILDGSSIVTTGTSEPLLSFVSTSASGIDITAARNFFAAGVSDGGPAPSLSLSGPLLSASFTNLRSGDPTANVFGFVLFADGTQVTSTSSSPFLTLNDSTLDSAGDVLAVRRATGTPTRMSLAGPLLVATNSSINHTSLGFGPQFGLNTTACCNAFFIGQGGQLSSTTTEPLIQLIATTVTGRDEQSGGIFFQISDTFSGAPFSEPVLGGSVSLQGPLLKVSSSEFSSLFSLLHVQRSTLVSTSPLPLIELTGSGMTLGGINPLTEAEEIGNLLFLVGSVAAGQVGPAAAVTLGGPLFKAEASSFDSGSGNVVSIINGATYTAGGAGAMLQIHDASLAGFNLLLVSGLGGTDGATKATVNLAGPVLAASASTITLGSNVIGIANGGALTSTTTAALIQLSEVDVLAGTSFGGAALLQINGGASPGLVTLNGPVLAATENSMLEIPGALLATFAGGQLVVNDSTDPVFAFTGGDHSIGTGESADRDAIFILNGLAAQTANEEVETGTILELGTRQPVQAAGSLLEMTSANVTTNKVLRLDTALLEASAPIINLKANAGLQTFSDAVDLIQKAKLTTSAINPMIRLDGSHILVSDGALVAVRGGSFLNIGGDLLAMNNASTLSLNNGTILTASGGSVVKIQGGLVNFGGVGNTINITNNLCPGGCTVIGGLKVFLTNGALAGNVTVDTPIINPGGGTINFSNGGNTAHITVDGATTKVRIGNPG